MSHKWCVLSPPHGLRKKCVLINNGPKLISLPPCFSSHFFFYVDSSFRLHLTLSHFGSMRRPLSLHQSLSFFSLNLSLFFPPCPPPPSPKHGTLLASLLRSLRTGSEKGSNSATPPQPPFSEARRSHKQPRGLVGSQMVAAELSFC